MNAETQSQVERPLSAMANLVLSIRAGATVALAYLFALSSTLFLLLVIGLEFVLLIALARVGLVGIMAKLLANHVSLWSVFLRSFWLRKGVECRIAVDRAEAPGLFSSLDQLCRQVGVELPKEVFLEMHTNAWVVLKGYRRGAGTTFLGLGYDLLAGMSEAELEAVLAHELTHAKLVRRGLKRWLNSGFRPSRAS